MYSVKCQKNSESERQVIIAQYNVFFSLLQDCWRNGDKVVSFLEQKAKKPRKEWYMWNFTCMLVASVANSWCG